MTFARMLEILVSAPDIEFQWLTMIPKENRREAGKAMVTFIKQHGQLTYNSHLDQDNPSRVYYHFPTFSSGRLSCRRNNIPGLHRLYNFFFTPRKVIVVDRYS
jgi:hypothetical protein